MHTIANNKKTWQLSLIFFDRPHTRCVEYVHILFRKRSLKKKATRLGFGSCGWGKPYVREKRERERGEGGGEEHRIYGI